MLSSFSWCLNREPFSVSDKSQDIALCLSYVLLIETNWFAVQWTNQLFTLNLLSAQTSLSYLMRKKYEIFRRLDQILKSYNSLDFLLQEILAADFWCGMRRSFEIIGKAEDSSSQRWYIHVTFKLVITSSYNGSLAMIFRGWKTSVERFPRHLPIWMRKLQWRLLFVE